MTKNLKTTPKISVKIWRPIINKLDEKLDTACLRRDAYLAKVLAVELDHLDDEVSIPNTQASYDFVFSQLDAFDRKLVSLALPPELTSRLNEICARKRIVRDAFFNRLFLLLAAAPAIVDDLLFEDFANDWRRDVWSEYKHEGPFFQNGFYPLEPMVDPFWAVRCGMEMYAEKAGFEDYVEPISGKSIRITRDLGGVSIPVDSVYTTVFTKKSGANDLRGLSCYLPDRDIPGHDAEKAHQAKLDDLLGKFGLEN